jgi:hypothetical protein
MLGGNRLIVRFMDQFRMSGSQPNGLFEIA